VQALRPRSFPRRELRNACYPDIEELFDVLDEKVKVAKRDFRVRVFNLSFSLGQRNSRLAYSVAADRLDRIARANDVIFVVAAGNLVGTTRRRGPRKRKTRQLCWPGSERRISRSRHPRNTSSASP
jgi:hypothetical protein